MILEEAVSLAKTASKRVFNVECNEHYFLSSKVLTTEKKILDSCFG